MIEVVLLTSSLEFCQILLIKKGVNKNKHLKKNKEEEKQLLFYFLSYTLQKNAKWADKQVSFFHFPPVCKATSKYLSASVVPNKLFKRNLNTLITNIT